MTPHILLHEKKTVERMLMVYCRNKHKSKSHLCPACEELKIYAFARLDKCPFGEKKPACKHCEVHCYSKPMRERIRQVMRYSGVRMLFYYPLDFFIHFFKKK